MKQQAKTVCCLLALALLAACAQPAAENAGAAPTAPPQPTAAPTAQPQQSEAAPPAAQVTRPVQDALTELIWPEGDYLTMDEAGQEAYRAAVEKQLAADEYLLLPDGTPAQNPACGRYTPEEFARAYPDAAALGTVGEYTLTELQLGYSEAVDAQPGTVCRYEQGQQNIRGVTLVYRKSGAEATVRVCYIGCGAPTEATAPAEADFAQEVLSSAAGIYTRQAQGRPQGLVQLNAAADSEPAFRQITEPFMQNIGSLLVFPEPAADSAGAG